MSVLLIIAIICWFIAAAWQPGWPAFVSLGWLGMFFFGLHLLIGK